MLGQIVKNVAKIIAGCFVASSVSALDFSEQTYEVYFGDFNGDGKTGDVYFHEKDKFVLIHGDIAIPLSIAGNGSYVVYESGDGTAVSLKLQASQLNGYTKGVLGQDYSFGDVNGDGLVDITASLAGSAPEELTILGASAGAPIVNNTSTIVNFPDAKGSIVSPSLPSLPTAPALDLNIDRLTEIPGNFSVDLSGQATYSIPIEVGRGTAGFQPSVSLNYNSGNSGDSSLMGIGWSLSAAGSISRCRQTWGQDKNPMPITWSSDDRFCVNGQRLVLESGSYGAPGSTYKTEIDSFALFTAVGGDSATGTPSYFKAEYKNGVTEYFGSTSDSKLYVTQGSSSNVFSWKLSLQVDSAGNPITYVYDASFEERPLSHIYYAYDVGHSISSAHIQFEYESKKYDKKIYISGYRYNINRLLNKIKVYSEDIELASYLINYDEGLTPIQSDYQNRMTSVQRCVESVGVCSLSTVFSWTTPSEFSFKNDIASIEYEIPGRRNN